MVQQIRTLRRSLGHHPLALIALVLCTALVFGLLHAHANRRSELLMPLNVVSLMENPPRPTTPLIVPSETPAAVKSTREREHWFNGRRVHPVGVVWMRVTAYSPDWRSCGRFADGITASGYPVDTNGMKLVAADTKLLPFGSLISIPGYDQGEIVPVLDRGGRIKGHRLDVLFPSHEAALEWGVQSLPITIWDYADGEPRDFVPRF